MSILYLVGAGASFGERLTALGESPPPVCRTDVTPPLTTGFFAASFFERTGYGAELAEQDFRDAFAYIRRLKQIPEAVPIGDGEWAELDLEEIFTSIELSREFQGQESDAQAQYTLIRNSLIRYVWRMIAYCTLRKYGAYSRKLIQSLPWDHTLITFNYDLLLDQEQITPHGLGTQYEHFSELVLERRVPFEQQETGMFLKLHGSLNWFRCSNAKCPSGDQVMIDQSTDQCLNRAIGIHGSDESCRYCGSPTAPVIIPPLLRKPVTGDPIIRNVWGLAQQKLSRADAVVVIGFSAAPTDFYASWLLRITVGVNPDAEVVIVNPANDPEHKDHMAFSRRMRSIFPAQVRSGRLHSQFHFFEQMDPLLDFLQERRWILRQ